jgi:hypothetical protein
MRRTARIPSPPTSKYPPGAGEGALIPQSARFGGWSLYLKGIKSNTVTTGSTEIATPSSPRIGFPPAERPSNSNFIYDGGASGKNSTGMPYVKAAVKILTKEQRHESGKALRVKCPRASHGEVVLGQGDECDVVKLIDAQNKDRLQNLVPICHGRMVQSAFAYFRGMLRAARRSETKWPK